MCSKVCQPSSCLYKCSTQRRTDKTGAGQRFLHVVLSQKHPLQAVSGHAALVLRLGIALGVGTAGRGTLWRAQVVHEGQPVLPTEVHKFDLAHTWIKVDAWKKSRVKNQARFKWQVSDLYCSVVWQMYTSSLYKIIKSLNHHHKVRP